MRVDSKAQLIRARVVSNSIKVLFSLVLLLDINLSIQDTLLVRLQWLDKFLSEWRKDGTEATSALFRVSVTLNVGRLLALLGEDLTRQDNKACTLLRQDIGKVLACLWDDVVGPPGIVLREDGRPAGDMNIHILRVLVVSQKRLAVLPAVKSSNSAELGGHDRLKRLALSIAIDGSLHVGGLDLTAMVNDGTSLIDEGLENISTLEETRRRCL